MPCALALLALAFSGSSVATGRAMEEQFARMTSALRTLSYEGTLVHVHDNRLETLRIVRRVEGGQIREHLESLSGPERRLVREEGRVICHLAGEHPIAVRGQTLTADLLVSKPIDPRRLTPHYLVHPLGHARVAGRHTEVVGVIPRDSLRYGYRFYLDVESGLPLRTDLLGEEAEPIEQLVFTSVTLDVDQMPSPAAQGEPAAVETQVKDASSAGLWRFQDPPNGFETVMVDRSADPAGRSVEHYVLSDGLASVSVYVEDGVEDGLDGGSHMGAIHVAGRRISGHQVTVVGEVPEGTVEAILDSIVYAGGEAE